MRKVVCLAGDGIGPEVTAAMKQVVAATGAPIEWVDMPAGLSALATHGDTLPQMTINAIMEHRLAIKGPTNTPKGEGHSSVNVRLRQMFDLHVGFRPYRSLPFLAPRQPDPVDIVLFRQNTEGLYACQEELFEGVDGPEVRLTARFTAKAMTRLASRAFSYAHDTGRTKVTIVTKSNIHKKWGKLYREAFMAVAQSYPHVEAEEVHLDTPPFATEEQLVDAMTMMLYNDPGRFQVLVTENMFGDILSDLCAALIGGLGVAPGANIGDDCAIFESVHGSADDIAGHDKANPAALILSAGMLLAHAGHPGASARIRGAVNEVMATGQYMTGDLRKQYPAGTGIVGTRDFADAVCVALTA